MTAGKGRHLAPLALGLGLIILAACLDAIVGADCRQGFTECQGKCVDLTVDPDNCGACGNVCSSCSASVCLPSGGDGGIPPGDGGASDGGGRDGGASDGGGSSGPDGGSCDAGTYCGTCVDTNTDRNHCGRCDNVCSSGICTAGRCRDTTRGHVVLIGHDYTMTRSGMNRLVGNSVFLGPGAPVNVLVWDKAASSAAIQGTDAAINQVAGETGRSWSRTTVPTAVDVAAALEAASIFLVYAQRNATDGTLVSWGNLWKTALERFSDRGGIVVLLDGEASHGGTYQILQAAGLFTASGRTAVTGAILEVVDPGDAVANGVPSMYVAEMTSVVFATSESRSVVQDASGRPVVIHKVP